MAVAVRGGAVPRRDHAHRSGQRVHSGPVPPGRAAGGVFPGSPWAGRGRALGSAVIESWHSTLEFELRSLETFATKAAARARIAAWIEEYNHERRHSALGMRSPVDYERSLAGKDAA